MSEALGDVVASIRALPAGQGAVIVGVDGVDGSGKTTFTARLADTLRPSTVLVIHADDHLNPPEVRYARGRSSPEGFWLDTYDRSSMMAAVDDAYRASDGGTFVIVEGMFLHREELRSLWDFSVFLDVPFAVTAGRMAERDGTHPDPEHASMRRYVGGQRLYFGAASPWHHADLVVDNSAHGARVIEAESSFAATAGETPHAASGPLTH